MGILQIAVLLSAAIYVLFGYLGFLAVGGIFAYKKWKFIGLLLYAAYAFVAWKCDALEPSLIVLSLVVLLVWATRKLFRILF